MSEPESRSFTGRRRERRTSRGVVASDIAARTLITVGGIGTIVAVLGVGLYLLKVAAPLLFASHIVAENVVPSPASAAPLHIQLDAYRRAGWALLPDGQLVMFRTDNGEVLERSQVVDNGPTITATSFVPGANDVALGFSDGSVRMGSISLTNETVTATDLPDAIHSMPLGQTTAHDGALIERLTDEHFRRQRLNVRLGDPVSSDLGSAVRLLDYTYTQRGDKITRIFAAMGEDGGLRMKTVSESRNPIDDDVMVKERGGELPIDADENGLPSRLFLAGLGDNVLLLWDDGRAVRYDTRNINKSQVAEKLDLLPEPEARVTSAGWLLGRGTLLVGDSLGRVRGWFRTRPDGIGGDADTLDRNVFTLAHDLPPGQAAATSLASSSAARIAAAGFADGSVRLYQVTNETVLDELTAGQGEISALSIASKDDGLLAMTPQTMIRWDVKLAHPEATLGALFRPVWYEGYSQPEYVWQSSSGTNDEEPKYSLIPLIFGTLKATFYALIFGVPLALAAAVFTSEFMHRRMRARIKPVIEMMASLPSVVLGFLAALYVAPLVERMVPAILISFFVIPLMFLLGAYLWQLLPQNLTIKMARFRIVLISAALLAGLWLAGGLGPVVERDLLGGNFKAWADGQIGSGVWAWMLLFLPVAAVAVVFLAQVATSWQRTISADWSRGTLAVVGIIKFLVGVAATIGLALVLSSLLPWLGWMLFGWTRDGRGTFVAAYDQRNALVVGFMLGFAIIPLIYTIADDALASVPDHLRSASLGAGATPWQTTVRIVIPTAMSGLFSAVMIGLGRAVGETMIVLMAAGNTPLMDLNIFNGFRTLSANIAVEMPEAVKDSTHFRILFLAALVLFAMTFAVNTVAEIIRLRFRRRSHEL
ncbi:MAG: hypothetical protein AB7O62_09700 [Pirellulales bacterium]